MILASCTVSFDSWMLWPRNYMYTCMYSIYIYTGPIIYWSYLHVYMHIHVHVHACTVYICTFFKMRDVNRTSLLKKFTLHAKTHFDTLSPSTPALSPPLPSFNFSSPTCTCTCTVHVNLLPSLPLQPPSLPSPPSLSHPSPPLPPSLSLQTKMYNVHV